MTVDMWQAVAKANEGGPTVQTILTGFATIVGLFILREFRVLYDWRLKNEGIPAKIEVLSKAMHAFTKRFDDHCDEERKWQADTRDAAIRAQNHTQETLTRVEVGVDKRFDALEARLPPKRVR